ncbi:hypothetical protein I316_04044 [Kwoniella heveanensis BCC8398]|uniref:BTB domain-containing protein n=1 Tax=Kwoniella heveanensis BCC8398 TaxID=1296120 RepID=A0A1B9GSY5_9TREE|nr:hypothetical protein I316_04044 [Kwoniella heveanensis BCC8398]
MPSIFRTSSGKEYEYHEKYDGPEGDLVIISSDDKALRCEKAALLVNSSVFRSMFSTCDSDGSKVHLDHPASALATVLQALNHRLSSRLPSGKNSSTLSTSAARTTWLFWALES